MKEFFTKPVPTVKYVLLFSLISVLGFVVSFIFKSQTVSADVPVVAGTDDYCGISGVGYMTSYCTGLGYNTDGSCGSASGGACCDGGAAAGDGAAAGS